MKIWKLFWMCSCSSYCSCYCCCMYVYFNVFETSFNLYKHRFTRNAFCKKHSFSFALCIKQGGRKIVFRFIWFCIVVIYRSFEFVYWPLICCNLCLAHCSYTRSEGSGFFSGHRSTSRSALCNSVHH